jgi:hypothetical protein
MYGCNMKGVNCLAGVKYCPEHDRPPREARSETLRAWILIQAIASSLAMAWSGPEYITYPLSCSSMSGPRMRLYPHAWPRNWSVDSAPPSHSQNPPRFRLAPLRWAEMPSRSSLHGKQSEGRVRAWLGMIWITLVWMHSHKTQTAPFCMAAVLHGRPGLGPECDPCRKIYGMLWKAKVMYISQGFWITSHHPNQRRRG